MSAAVVATISATCQVETDSLQTVSLDSTVITTQKYDDSGDGVYDRRVIYRNIRPILKYANGESGKIGFKVCVNPKGEVVSSEIIANETTIENSKVLEQATEAIYGYKYEANSKSLDIECGMIVINITPFGKKRRF